jgi:hypothetical protein
MPPPSWSRCCSALSRSGACAPTPPPLLTPSCRETAPLTHSPTHRYALERELHELTAKAMHAPTASLAEAKALRLQLADQQRSRSAAELRELDARRELERIQATLVCPPYRCLPCVSYAWVSHARLSPRCSFD